MMRLGLKLLVPLLVLAEVALVWSGIMDLGDAVIVVAIVEALLFLIGLVGTLLIVRRYREERKTGLDPWMALEDALSLVLPRKGARLAVHEPRLHAALFRWTFQRVRPGYREFAYHRRSLMRAIMPMVILTSPIELFTVHMLAQVFSPWDWLKWVLLALGIYAILWLLGFYASLIVFPHRLEETGITLRYGAFTEGFVPYEEIQDTVRKDRKAPGPGDGLQHVPDEDALYLAVGGKTSVTLHLRTPHYVCGFLKDSAPASIFHIIADEPGRLTQELRRRAETPVS